MFEINLVPESVIKLLMLRVIANRNSDNCGEIIGISSTFGQKLSHRSCHCFRCTRRLVTITITGSWRQIWHWHSFIHSLILLHVLHFLGCFNKQIAISDFGSAGYCLESLFHVACGTCIVNLPDSWFYAPPRCTRWSWVLPSNPPTFPSAKSHSWNPPCNNETYSLTSVSQRSRWTNRIH